MDIKTKLNRFVNKDESDLIDVQLTKLKAFREGSEVPSGMSIRGSSYYRPFDDKTFGVEVYGRGFNHMGTSPVVEIVDETEKVITFATEGGLYKMELL
jgi:hypothetical protein